MQKAQNSFKEMSLSFSISRHDTFVIIFSKAHRILSRSGLFLLSLRKGWFMGILLFSKAKAQVKERRGTAAREQIHSTAQKLGAKLRVQK